ncbi:MAG: gluconokinase [Betaproteobacteria bacterium]|nr:gluconokinase [Betaproteobacteria bacterium]
MQEPLRLVVMGVSGSGKSTLAPMLADYLNSAFIEGDTLHSQANVDKMVSGSPLNDDDRAGWLATIAERIEESRLKNKSLVLSCSALKKMYRDRLRLADDKLVFIHLQGNKQLIQERMKARQGHYMKANLLDSQLATLEIPQATENVINLSIDQSIEAIYKASVDGLNQRP